MINLGKPSCLSTLWCANKLFASVYIFPLLCSECILACEMEDSCHTFLLAPCFRMSTFAANTLYYIEQHLYLFAMPVNFACLMAPAFAHLLQGMIEWEQERRAAEVDALQLALKEDGHSVSEQTRVSAVRLFLLDELHLMALSWRVTPRACAVSLTACCPVPRQLQPLPDPSLSCLQLMSH